MIIPNLWKVINAMSQTTDQNMFILYRRTNHGDHGTGLMGLFMGYEWKKTWGINRREFGDCRRRPSGNQAWLAQKLGVQWDN
jgi:hypothetical protein